MSTTSVYSAVRHIVADLDENELAVFYKALERGIEGLAYQARVKALGSMSLDEAIDTLDAAIRKVAESEKLDYARAAEKLQAERPELWAGYSNVRRREWRKLEK